MARQYSARTFLRNTPNHLLQQYFEERRIDLTFNWSLLGDTETNPLLAALEELPAATRSAIDSDFRSINDLACEAGTLAILNQAGGTNRGLADEFAGMQNAYERASWTFLHEPDLFRLADCFHEMDRRGGWRRRFVGIRLDAASDDDSLRAFEQALRMLYRRQGRGRFCHVDCYLRHDPIRHCYFAYPEDYACTEIGYDDHGRFQHRARRAAFEIIFVYRPEEGMLELRARGGKKQIAELQEVFCTHILDLEQLPDDDGRVPFDLTLLKNAAFAFPTDPEDRIASVEVRSLRLDMPAPPGESAQRRVILAVNSKAETGTALYRLMDDVLDTDAVSLSEVHLSEAKLRFTFEPTNGERPKTLTFEVKYPDRCTLKEDPHDQIAKRYLRKWGIAHE